ncbi:MAG: histidinol-phosphatase [Lentilitoribacter sp.]
MLPDISFFDKLAVAAAKETMPRFRSKIEIENKLDEGFDPVTAADKAAERAIRDVIEAEYPDHGILGEEEENKNLDSEFVWVIDPIDGTRAFITGLPVWGTLIGLYQNGRAVMGMMDQPFTGERFLSDGKSSFAKFRDGNTQVLKTSNCTELSKASMFTTTPELHTGDNSRRYFALENEIKLPRYGVDCYAYGVLAMGHADLVCESDLKPYDIGGLIAVVENAGGVVTKWDGGRPEMGGDCLAAATPELHAKALEVLNR